MKEKMFAAMKRFGCGLMVCLLAVLLPGMKSEAASKKPTCAGEVTSYFYTIDDEYYFLETYSAYIYIKNLSSSATVSSVKSSNSKISASSLVNTKYVKMNAIALSLKNDSKKIKEGATTTITFKVKQNGKTYNLSCNVTFRSAPSPVKSLKIGSKEYASAFEGTCRASLNLTSSGKKKITVKAASGYKIDKIYVSYMDGTTKTVKSGAKISTKNLVYISVYYSVKNKPANYKKPSAWTGKLSSPLQEFIELM